MTRSEAITNAIHTLTALVGRQKAGELVTDNIRFMAEKAGVTFEVALVAIVTADPGALRQFETLVNLTVKAAHEVQAERASA